MKKYLAEFIGTFTLVLFGTGVAAITGGNIILTSLAFGLAIIASSYVIGNVSGCHVNPAVSFAMLLSKKLSLKDFIWYVVSQILGALSASLVLYLILSTTSMGTISLGITGYSELSPLNITVFGALITEIILTFVFIYTILGVTSDERKSNVSGIIIGLTLTFIHLFGIVLTGSSVNPARSLAPAIVEGGKALSQVWLYIVSPLIGSALAVFTFKYVNNKK